MDKKRNTDSHHYLKRGLMRLVVPGIVTCSFSGGETEEPREKEEERSHFQRNVIKDD